MAFAPRHVVTMAVAFCAAVVLAPVGVMAATGTITNIVDPYDGNRRARVSSGNALQVESRGGVFANSFTYGVRAFGIGRFKVHEATGPTRIALTEVTLGSHGTTNGATSGHNYVDLVSYVQTTGTGACGTTSTGYVRTEHRRFIVMNLQPTYQVLFDGPAFLSPQAPDGKRICLTLEISTFTSGSEVDMGATGYRVS